MKKLIAAATAILLTTGLTACSGNTEASVASTASGSELTTAEIKLDLPENWTVTVGDKVYEIIVGLGSTSDESTSAAESFKALCEENGTSYLAYAVNDEGTVVLTITALTITDDETTGEHLYLEEYARQNHDTEIFNYQANGGYIRNSSFGEEKIAGKDGYLSHFELCTDEEVSQMVYGQSEFIYELNGRFCSVQTYYENETAAAESDAVLASLTAE